jgi:uncharacterized protein (DUF488 family)
MMTTIYTLGHAAHPLQELLALLRARGIEVVVDVRSNPYSRHSPHLCQRPLRGALERRGLQYRFEGQALGGRLPERYPDYASRARAADFVAALQRVLALAREQPVALLCGEEDPRRCHRRMLVGRELTARGWEVVHIRGDGRLEPEGELLEQERRQLGLFGDDP